MTSRIQIALNPELHRRARDRAAQLGISFAEYVRRLVARDLSEPTPAADRSVVFNLGSTGEADVSREKDRMVGDAVEVEWRRETGR